ncbi:MAG: CoA transferase [Acidimicrobiia bacterium]|jgi:crotonobetainyl-CoA:carnitine CoA-transferase CaiB-like acyl-CoA transferase
MSDGLLSGIRVIESSMLGPAEMGGFLADLGADVIKIEPPGGDYGRQMTWPIVEGSSLLSLHVNRNKRSVVLDLRKSEAVEVYLDLIRDADAVIEAMRPGALARRGLTFARMQEANPRIVFCSISGYGATGPYKDMPSHGIAYDTWAGTFNPAYDEDGFCYIPEHASMGIHAGPLMGALGILGGILRARASGAGCQMEIAQSDAAAYMDWYRIESYKAYERPQSEVTGNATDNYERRAPGTAGMKEGVRYQIYESSDGHVLFMASEREFWKNFCEGVGRADLFEQRPGEKYADHARNNKELQGVLRDIFHTRTSAEWIAFGNEHNTPIAPVNTPKTIMDDPQFQHRFHWYPAAQTVADTLGFPLNIMGEDAVDLKRAPEAGEHVEDVLGTVLGYDADKVAALRAAGVFGDA